MLATASKKLVIVATVAVVILGGLMIRRSEVSGSRFKNALSQFNPFKSEEAQKPVETQKIEAPEEAPTPTEKENYGQAIIIVPNIDKQGRQVGSQKVLLTYSKNTWELKEGQSYEGFEGQKMLVHKNLFLDEEQDSPEWVDLGTAPLGEGDLTQEGIDSKREYYAELKLDSILLGGRGFKRLFEDPFPGPFSDESEEQESKTGKEPITVTYYYPLGRMKWGSPKAGWYYQYLMFPLYTRRDHYKQCISDLEEVLKTLEFMGAQREQT